MRYPQFTPQFTRRGFASLAAAGLASLAKGQTPAAPMPPATGNAPDLCVFNAKVYTVDSRLPSAEAFAVKDGRFTAIGNTAEIKNLIGKGTQPWTQNK